MKTDFPLSAICCRRSWSGVDKSESVAASQATFEKSLVIVGKCLLWLTKGVMISALGGTDLLKIATSRIRTVGAIRNRHVFDL
jgi:hypothetical protein